MSESTSLRHSWGQFHSLVSKLSNQIPKTKKILCIELDVKTGVNKFEEAEQGMFLVSGVEEENGLG